MKTAYLAIIAVLILGLVGIASYVDGYEHGYRNGMGSVADDIVAENKAAIEASAWYVEPVDMEMVIIEKMIDAMSRAEMELVIEDGDIISGRIHIYWEKD